MNSLAEILIAVANSLWLAALAAALVWLALAVLPKIGVHLNAATRHLIWWTVLLVVVLVPLMPRHVPPHRGATKSVTPGILSPAPPETPPLMIIAVDRAPRWPLWIAGIWTALLLYRLQQIARSYFRLRGVKARAAVSTQPLPATTRRARLLISAETSSPLAAGFLRPAVVLPEALGGELTGPELDYVVLHESAHLARYDDWGNLAARLLGAVLCLHPVALWILRRIEHECEIACDDWVVARTGAARRYAVSLARLFEILWSRRGELLASGIFGSRSRLGDRIEMILRRGRSLSPQASRARVAVCVAPLLLLALAGTRAPRWIALAQPPERQSFEVASVKPGDPKDLEYAVEIRPGGRFKTTNATLRQLVAFAYDVRSAQITGGPDWANSERYSIEAKANSSLPVPFGQPGVARLRLMLQSLLADRFGLTVHHETREETVYELVVAKGGPKLKEAADSETERARIGRGEIEATAEPIATMIRPLSQQLGRSIVDKTGLEGLYDFTLQWTPEIAPDGPGPSIFTALPDQLGLKLEAARGRVERLVIDRAERPAAD